MLQMTMTQIRRKCPLVRMKSTLTRCELRITKTMSSTSTSAATMALAPRLDPGEADDPDELPGTGLPPEAGVLRRGSGQPALMGKV